MSGTHDGDAGVEELTGHTDRVWSLSWHHGTLASAGADSTVRLWRRANNKWTCVTQLQGPQRGTIRSVNFSPSGRQLVTGSFDGTVCVWERAGETTAQWECYATLEGHENEVKDACFSASGEYLASCSRDKTVWIWEHLDDMEEYDCCSILNDHSQDVKCLRWHPEQDLLASGSYDNTICIYRPDPDVSDWTCVHKLTGHENTVWGLAFNRDGSMLASVSADKTLRIWAYSPKQADGGMSSTDGTWTCVSTLSGFHTRSIYSVDWCPVSNLIATGCGDNHVRVFKPKSAGSHPTWDKLFDQELHAQDVNCVVWCTRGGGGGGEAAATTTATSALPLLASASDDETIKVARIACI